MSRLYRKNFDKILDQCHVDIPYHNGKKYTMINGMKHPLLRDELWSSYYAYAKGKNKKEWRMFENSHGSVAENLLWGSLAYFFWSRYEYEWWVDGEKVAWFDPNDEDTWNRVLAGCEPLIKLFEELEDERH